MVGRNTPNFSEVGSTLANSPNRTMDKVQHDIGYNESAAVTNPYRISVATLISLCLVLVALARTSSFPLNLDSIFHSEPLFVVVEGHTPRAPTVQNAAL
jgi:hypothetical protein